VDIHVGANFCTKHIKLINEISDTTEEKIEYGKNKGVACYISNQILFK